MNNTFKVNVVFVGNIEQAVALAGFYGLNESALGVLEMHCDPGPALSTTCTQRYCQRTQCLERVVLFRVALLEG